MTIATTAYPGKKIEEFQNGGIFYSRHCLYWTCVPQMYLLFSEIGTVIINW